MRKFYTMKEVADQIKEKRPDIIEAMAHDELQYRIAQAIISARNERKWSQEMLAKHAGLTQAQVSRLESAQVGHIHTVIKAFNALGLKLKVQS
ncbi:MAG: helix-turn-helix transcriptional regulator [Bacillota bacterium]|nr:helix-turn-helix transcriptional regulator [Bacillota bacterium]